MAPCHTVPITLDTSAAPAPIATSVNIVVDPRRADAHASAKIDLPAVTITPAVSAHCTHMAACVSKAATLPCAIAIAPTGAASARPRRARRRSAGVPSAAATSLPWRSAGAAGVRPGTMPYPARSSAAAMSPSDTVRSAWMRALPITRFTCTDSTPGTPAMADSARAAHAAQCRPVTPISMRSGPPPAPGVTDARTGRD